MTNTKQKIRFSIFSILLAFAMMLTFNFSFVGAVANFVQSNNFALATDDEEISEDNYVATKSYTFDFVSDNAWHPDYKSSTTNNTDNYLISANKSIVGFAADNNYYPIAKYNGVPSTTDKRTRDNITTDIDKADNYGAVISLNDYQVANKEYNSNKFVTVNDGEKDVNKIYLQLSSATAAADLNQLIAKIDALNTAVGYNKYEVVNQFAETYESAAYATVSSTSNESDYTAAVNQVNAIVENKTEGDDLYQFDLTSYELYFKKTYDFVENYFYFYTQNTNIELVNSSYYCLSVWVYTAGEATATIRLAGTNLDAKIENISTLGNWIQYYLFVETRSADPTNDAKIYLYYGNTDGVTGPRTLDSYNTGVDQYDTTTGTVVFDDICVYSINYMDYTNRTINGKAPNTIAQTYIADGYAVVSPTENQKLIKNSTVATNVDVIYLLNTAATQESDLDTLKEKVAELNNKLDYSRYQVVNQFISSYNETNYQAVSNPSTLLDQIVAETSGQVDGLTVTDYALYTAKEESTITKKVAKFTYTNYADLAQLSSAHYYSARYYKGTFENSFDTTFDTTALATKADLVYNYNDTTELKFNSYETSNKYFSYYMPRYTSDTNTTNLSENLKNVYRNQYENNLDVSIVAEADQEWNTYKRYVLDAKGEKIQTGTDENDNPIYETETVSNNTFANNNKILKLDNTSESYDLGVVSSALVVPANAIYKITVWAYSNDKDATATAKLFASVKTKESLNFGTLQLASATAKDFEFNGNDTNGWKEINFYVKGNPTSTQKVYLVLIASANDTVYFDNITVETVSSSSFINGSKTLNLATYGVLSSNIKNGTFNNFSVDGEDNTYSYPYKAEDWTAKTDDNVRYGIVSTNNTIYSDIDVIKYNNDGEIDYYDIDKISVVGETVYYDGNPLADGSYIKDYAGKYARTVKLNNLFGGQAAPTTLTGNENVYAVYMPDSKSEFKLTSGNSSSTDGIGSSSSSSSLSAEKVYKVTAQVWFAPNFEGNLAVRLTYNTSANNSQTISEHLLEIDNSMLTMFSKWHTFTFYIRTGNLSRSDIKIEFEATKATGTFFIQNVNNIEIADITNGNVKTSAEDQFEALLSANKTNANQQASLVRFVDLKDNNFTMHSAKADETTNIYDAYSYKKETLAKDAEYTQGKIGVINLGTGANDGFKFADTDPIIQVEPKAGTADNPNTALIIYNTGDADYTLANSVFNNSLSSSEFYKVTVDVYTCTDFEEGQGLTISANGFEDTKFENLNTNGQWKTYTFYLRTGSDTVTFALTYALGDKTEGYSGWTLVSNMQIENLDEDEYTTITTDEDVLADNTVVIKSLYKEAEEENKDEDKDDKEGFSWQTFFLVFSSILLVVTLVIALVAIIIKRNKKKAKPVIAANNKPEGGIA